MRYFSMFFINFSLSVLLFAFIFYYVKILKKRLSGSVLLLLFSILPLAGLLRSGTYQSGDFSINIYKAMDFYISLSRGIFFPRWASVLNGTFGYPNFNFTYPLPYYAVAFFHLLGFSFISGLKVVLGLTFVASGFAMYFWIKEEIDEKAALVSGIFYLYAPYHFVDMNFRVSLGEIFSFVFLPLGFLGVSKLVKTSSRPWLVFFGLIIAILMLCNQAIVLVALPVLLLYGIFLTLIYHKNLPGKIVRIISSVLLGFGLSAYYWIPALTELKFTHQAQYVARIGYVFFLQLIYSPYRYGLLFQGPEGELSFVIGYIHLLVILLGLFYLFRKKTKFKDKMFIIFFLCLTGILVYMMLPISSIVWNNVSILRNFQFTYRLLLIVAVCTSFIAGILTKYLNKNLVVLLIFLVIFSSILNWGNRRTIPTINDQVLRSNLPYSTYQGEGFGPAAPVWVNLNNPWQKTVPKNHLQVISGKATIKELSRKVLEHIYSVDVLSPSRFKENTLYFPAWTVFANNKKINIKYDDPKYPGIITFRLPKGKYTVEVEFLSTRVRIISGYISIASIVIVCLILLYPLIYRELH